MRAPVVDKFIVQRIPRQSLHDVALSRLVGEGDGRHHVRAEVDTEDRDRAQRQRNVGDDKEQERRDLRDVASQRVGDRLLQIVEDQSTLHKTPVKLLSRCECSLSATGVVLSRNYHGTLSFSAVVNLT